MKKATSLILAAVMMTSSVFPVYATDAEMVPETVDEATISTEAILETEQETDAKENATEVSEASEGMDEKEAESETKEEYNPYIILLPSDGFSYDVDSEHVSDEYSTSEYKILLYEEGEHVKFSVNSDKNFSLMDAVNNSVYKERSENYDFSMPAVDLAIVEEAEATKENVQKEEQIEETSSETEALEVSDPELEDFLMEDFSEESTEAVTEAITEVKQDVTEATEVETNVDETEEEVTEVLENETEIMPEETAEVDSADVMEPEAFTATIKNTEGYDGEIPEYTGQILIGKNIQVVKGDSDFDIQTLKMGYDPVMFNVILADDGGFDVNTVGNYLVKYEVSSLLAMNQFWYVESVVSVIDAEENSNIVKLGSSFITAKVTNDQGDSESLEQGYQIITDSNISEISVRAITGKLDVKVNIEKKDGMKDLEYSVEKTSDTTAVVKFEKTEEKGYVITITSDSEDVLIGKSSSGWIPEGLAEHIVSIDGQNITLDGTYDNKVITVEELSGMLDDFIVTEEEEIAEDDASLDPMDASLGSKTISKAGKFSGVHLVDNYGGCPNPTGYDTGKVTITKKTEVLDTIEELLDKGDWTGDRSTISSKMGSTINVSCKKHGYWAPPNHYGGNAWKVKVEVSINSAKTKATIKLTVPNKGYSAGGYSSASWQVLGGSKSFSIPITPSEGKIHLIKAFGDKELADLAGLDFSTEFRLYENKTDAVDDFLDSCLVSNDNPDIIFEDLVPATYYMREVTTNYGMRPNTTALYSITISKEDAAAGKPTTTATLLSGNSEYLSTDKHTVKNSAAYYAGVLLKKVDNKTGNATPLAGAEIEVTYTPATNFGKKAVWYFVTDAKGEIKYDPAYLSKTKTSSPMVKTDKGEYKLPAGYLYFKEINAPEGYLKNPETLRSDLVYNNGDVLTFNPVVMVDEEIVPVSIAIQKYKDKAMTDATPISDKYNFEGAEYGLYEWVEPDGSVSEDALLDTIELNKKGFGVSSPIMLGEGEVVTYYIKELKQPTCGAYELDSQVYPVSAVKCGEYRTVKVYDKPVTGSIHIEKFLDGLTKDQIAYAKEKGWFKAISFDLKHENEGIKTKEGLVLDKDGKLTVDGLTCGKWTITEHINTNVLVGFKAIEPKVIELTPEDLTGKSTYQLDVKNYPEEGYVKIYKKDKDTGNTITFDETVFRIIDPYGKVFPVQIAGTDKFVEEFSTTDGVVEFENKFKGGVYRLEEIKAPKGYKKGEPITFAIDKDYTKVPLEVSYKDAPKLGKLSVTKVDKVTGNHCGAGYKFEVVVAEPCLDGSGAVRPGYEKGSVVDTITTDENGVATSKDLYIGKYYVQEVAVGNDGLAINTQKYDFEIKEEADDKPMVVDMTIADKPTNLLIRKVDKIDEGVLEGVTFRVKVKGSEDSDDQLYVSDKDGNISVDYLKKNTTYEVSEVKTIPGYNLCEEVVEFSVDEKGLIDGKDHYEVIFTNQPNVVEISKTDITTGVELPGAKMVITDESGKVFEEWTSTEESHIIYHMPAGKYTLTEVTAPEGYEVEEAVQFEIIDSLVIQKVEMKDSPYREVVVSKKDITNDQELPGATLVIKDAANNVVDEWVSEAEPHHVKLHSGIYTLSETIPADGYVTANTITFEVIKTTADDYDIKAVEMKDDITKTTISKKDITTGDELPGAKLEIRDKDGNVVESWISTDEIHYIEKLPIGKYTLTEITAPDGYEVAETIEFEVKDTPEIQHYEMFDSPNRDVEISKKDITNSEELPGAVLKVTDLEGNTVEEWTSTEEAHKISLPSGKYVLTETKPADGYITAESIDFEVLRRDKEGDFEIQHVEMFDDITKIQISKQDITNKKELPGAKLAIKDSEGKDAVEPWVSTNEPHYIEKLPIGEYTLVEITAPNGYDVAESVKFTVEDTDIIQHVTMFDSPTPQPSEGSPQTGDNVNVPVTAAIILTILILIGGGTLLLRKKKKN